MGYDAKQWTQKESILVTRLSNSPYVPWDGI